MNTKREFVKLFLCLIFIFTSFNFSFAEVGVEDSGGNSISSEFGVTPESISAEPGGPDTRTNNPVSTSPTTHTETNYTLLAPLGNGATSSYKIEASGFSGYLSTITNYFFMIVAVLAAFYLVYGGIQYLTTDMSSLKLEGKETIKRVVVGLIFIFSIWTIFNSINPELLRSEGDYGLSEADDVENPNATGAVVVTDAAGNITIASPCIKIVKVSGIEVCDNLASSLTGLLDAAKKSGINLSGTGHRTSDKQIAKRRQNCGTTNYDIYQKPPSQCRPQTAIPGTSMHERGLAVDFSCGAGTKFADTPCYTWMKNNDNAYGFKNLSGEPWHWSINGR